jgi:hypothetical protein
MELWRKILRAVLYDDGAPGLYSGLLPNASGENFSSRRIEHDADAGKANAAASRLAKSRSS